VRRLALKRGHATWREAIGAGVAALVIVLIIRWLFDPISILDAVIGVSIYCLALMIAIGSRNPG
jgi:hypothetical protein